MAKPRKAGAGTNGSSPAASSASPDELLKFYRDMLLIRRFEERAGQLYGMGLIGGVCPPFIGPEAGAGGVQSPFKTRDPNPTRHPDPGPQPGPRLGPKGGSGGR